MLQVAEWAKIQVGGGGGGGGGGITNKFLVHLPVIMALPLGVISTALQVRLALVILSSSLPDWACHTLTSCLLLVANSSEESLQRRKELCSLAVTRGNSTKGFFRSLVE